MRRSSVSVVAVALLVLTSARAQLTYVYTDDAGDHLFGTASNWTPPNGDQGYYICKQYTMNPGEAELRSFTAVFEQRSAP